MPRINSFDARLDALEQSGGYVTLDDGSRFKPGAGIDIMRHQLRLRRDLGREPDLSDYPTDCQEQIKQFAKWTPDRDKYGQISLLVVELSKKLLENA